MVNVLLTDRKYGKHAKGNDTKTHTGTRNSSLLALCRNCGGKHVSHRNKCPAQGKPVTIVENQIIFEKLRQQQECEIIGSYGGRRRVIRL